MTWNDGFPNVLYRTPGFSSKSLRDRRVRVSPWNCWYHSPDLARALYFALIWPVCLPDRISPEWGVLDNTPSMSFGLKITHCLPSVHLGSTRGGKRQKSPGLMKSRRRSENDCGRLATQSSCKADACGWKGQVQRGKTLDWEQGELGSWPYYVISRQCAWGGPLWAGVSLSLRKCRHLDGLLSPHGHTNVLQYSGTPYVISKKSFQKYLHSSNLYIHS